MVSCTFPAISCMETALSFAERVPKGKPPKRREGLKSEALRHKCLNSLAFLNAGSSPSPDSPALLRLRRPHYHAENGMLTLLKVVSYR